MDKGIKDIIDLAKSAGSITQKQKEAILNKAKKTGEDVDEIEIILESIPVKEDKPKHISKIKKCPHCGATLSDFILQCPECGYVFSQESQVSEQNRNYLAELHSNIQKIEMRAPKNKDEREWDNKFKLNKTQEKINLISGFTIPNTKEALIQGLLGCYAAYESCSDISVFEKLEGIGSVKQAWLGKAKEFYYLLQSQPTIDSRTAEVLKKYAPLFMSADKHEHKSNKNARLIGIICILFFVLFFLGILVIIPLTD